LALVIEMPGKVVGMYNRSPSFRGGMNSDPMRLIGIQVTARTTTAATRYDGFLPEHHLDDGMVDPDQETVDRVFVLGLDFPRIR
jgi:hypothetical protein